MRGSAKGLCLLFACVLVASCGSDSSSSSGTTPTTPTTPTPTPATTTFQGTIAGATGETGTMTVTVQAQVTSAVPSFFRWPFVATLHAQGSVTATGSFRAAGGATTTLTGTYETSTRALSLTGGGYTFTGTASGATINGTYTGSSGAAGSFSSRSTASGTVTVYCGSIFGTNGTDVTGVFNLVVSEGNGAVAGTFYFLSSPFRNGPITGQLTGTSLSITYTDRVSGGSGTGTGTIQSGSVTGSSPAQSGGSNPFSGSTSRCQ